MDRAKVATQCRSRRKVPCATEIQPKRCELCHQRLPPSADTLADSLTYALIASYTHAVVKRTVPVSSRALIQRINRKLLADADGDITRARQVRTPRGGRAKQDLGDLFLLDVGRSFIVDHHLDLETLGRELKVLEPWEKLFE
jgi:hypothetical protein